MAKSWFLSLVPNQTLTTGTRWESRRILEGQRVLLHHSPARPPASRTAQLQSGASSTAGKQVPRGWPVKLVPERKCALQRQGSRAWQVPLGPVCWRPQFLHFC